jgi:hypothetical protein
LEEEKTQWSAENMHLGVLGQDCTSFGQPEHGRAEYYRDCRKRARDANKENLFPDTAARANLKKQQGGVRMHKCRAKQAVKQAEEARVQVEEAARLQKEDAEAGTIVFC